MGLTCFFPFCQPPPLAPASRPDHLHLCNPRRHAGDADYHTPCHYGAGPPTTDAATCADGRRPATTGITKSFDFHLKVRVVTSHLSFGSSRVIWSHFRVRVESVSRVTVQISVGTRHGILLQSLVHCWHVT